MRVRPSKKVEKWESDTADRLIDATKGNMYIMNCEIWFKVYFSRKGRAGGDADNKTTTLFDTLVKARILHDDSYDCVSKYHVETAYRKGEGGAEIIIEDMED